MNNVKKIILYVVLLVVLCFCGTIIMKIFDLILKLNYESVWTVGFKVGFIAWLGTLVGNEGYHWIKGKNK